MLLKQHVLLTCQGIHVNLIYGLYKIYYKLVCRKFLSTTKKNQPKIMFNYNIDILTNNN
jgi:hypothetical protein